MSSIACQLSFVRSTLPEGVKLVAVSKTHPAEAIRAAYDAGHRVFGESRPQELREKHEALPKDIEWHMIGHLQTNKIKYIAPFVALIHSVDSARLAEAIQREAAKCGRTLEILLEIHVAEEETKTGWNMAELMEYVRTAPFARMPDVCVRGVMGIATNTDDGTAIRRDFMELVDALLSYRIRIAQIYTNGKLVDEKLLDQLEERGIRPEFNMSYDGTQGWHDWMRGVPGAGDAVLAAFDLCHERGFPTGAEMCLHQGNKHLLRESVSTLAAHHCESLKVNPVADTDTWERLGEDRSLTLEETFEVYLDYIPCFYEDGAPLGLHLGGFFMGRPGSGDWTIPNIGKHPEERDPAACASQVTCGHARQTLYLSPEARMLPCMALSSMPMQERYPLATEIGLRQGLSDSEYLSLIDTRVSALWEHNPECAQCEHRGACAGGCRASALFTAPDDILSPDRAQCLILKGGYAPRIREAVEKAQARIAERKENE